VKALQKEFLPSVKRVLKKSPQGYNPPCVAANPLLDVSPPHNCVAYKNPVAITGNKNAVILKGHKGL